MAQLVIEDVDDTVVERLQRRAAERRQSLDQTLRDILVEAVKPTRAEMAAEMAHIRAMTPKRLKTDSTDLIREDRSRR